MGPLRLETAPTLPPMRSPYADARFTADVARIKEYIAAGDTFQTVLSRRIDLDAPDPFRRIATCGRSIRRRTSISCTATTSMCWGAPRRFWCGWKMAK
jgi:hypothetical protein